MPSEKTFFPSAPQASLLLLAGFFLQYFFGAALYDIRQLLGITREQSGAIAMLLANGVLIAVVMQWLGLSYRELTHPSKFSPLLYFIFLVPPVLLLVPLALLLDLGLISGMEAVFPVAVWEQQAFDGMVAPTLSAFVGTCLIAPVVEEMLFRGILLRAFLTRYSRGVAIGYSALYFGVAHLNIYQFLLAFLLGLLLGELYERSRSLIPCVALHAALNVGVSVLSLSSESAATLQPSAVPLTVWLGALVAAGIGVTALRRLLAGNKIKPSRTPKPPPHP